MSSGLRVRCYIDVFQVSSQTFQVIVDMENCSAVPNASDAVDISVVSPEGLWNYHGSMVALSKLVDPRTNTGADPKTVQATIVHSLGRFDSSRYSYSWRTDERSGILRVAEKARPGSSRGTEAGRPLLKVTLNWLGSDADAANPAIRRLISGGGVDTAASAATVDAAGRRAARAGAGVGAGTVDAAIERTLTTTLQRHMTRINTLFPVAPARRTPSAAVAAAAAAAAAAGDADSGRARRRRSNLSASVAVTGGRDRRDRDRDGYGGDSGNGSDESGGASWASVAAVPAVLMCDTLNAMQSYSLVQLRLHDAAAARLGERERRAEAVAAFADEEEEALCQAVLALAGPKVAHLRALQAEEARLRRERAAAEDDLRAAINGYMLELEGAAKEEREEAARAREKQEQQQEKAAAAAAGAAGAGAGARCEGPAT
jgi:hypothetical protein